MKKILQALKEWWASFPKDKLHHFVYGLAICLFLGTIFTPLVGFIASVVAGIGKEIYDKAKGGKVEIGDFFFTLLGGALGGFILVVF